MTTVGPFANIVDADLPCVLMASVGPAVGGQGVINDLDPFGAAARGISRSSRLMRRQTSSGMHSSTGDCFLS